MKQITTQATVPTVGLDLGARKSSYCTLAPDGETMDVGEISMNRRAVERFFKRLPKSRVVMEASGSCRWTSKIAEHYGHEVIVVNPRKLAFITSSRKKCDRNDAKNLAEVGRACPQLLSPVHIRGDEAFLAQATLRARKQLVAARADLVNLVRGIARTSGFALPSCSTRAFAAKCRKELPEFLMARFEPVVVALEELSKQIDSYDREAERIGADTFPVTSLLRQVTGVGPVLALSFCSVIEDPHRFSDSRDVGAHVGLAPISRQSGGSNPQLRISKQGDSDLRRLLVSAATYILGPFGPDCDLRRYGQRIAASGSQAAKAKARIAVARKLACLLHRLWITGEDYRPLAAA